MKWLVRLFALFLIMPAAELALLVQVDKLIGFWPTIGLIVFTGLLGGYLAKREGISAWQRLNRRMTEGGLPGAELIDGVIILVAGALLVTPGVITDVVGFLGLLPPSRALIRRYVLKRVTTALERGAISAVGYDAWGSHPFAGTEAHFDDAGWEGTAAEAPRYAGEIPPPAPDGRPGEML